MRILIADDHALVRRGLRLLLGDAGFQDVVDAATGEEAIACAAEQHLDVAILDLRMPALDGISAARQLQCLTRPPATAILTMFEDITCVVRGLSAGARAILAKATVDEELIPAIQAMRSGGTFITKRLKTDLDEGTLYRLRTHGVQDPYDLLTAREKQVLHRLAQGLPNRQVARELEIGVATVETHRANLMEKLGLHNAAEIVLYVIRKRQLSQ